ncbi:MULTISPECIES: hypothetical protein [Clostridia]|jgi:hypothetical protein|nr:hypothetical protein [Clostridium sp. C105KSO13]CUX27906.1 hypothetical protein BN3456_01018 [Clostridium sp. C105KSO13]
MRIEEYKEIIFDLVTRSYDIEYLIAICTFAMNFPDKSKKQE